MGSRGHLSPPPKRRGYKHISWCQGFFLTRLLGMSDPHTCMAITFPAAPLPQALGLLLESTALWDAFLSQEFWSTSPQMHKQSLWCTDCSRSSISYTAAWVLWSRAGVSLFSMHLWSPLLTCSEMAAAFHALLRRVPGCPLTLQVFRAELNSGHTSAALSLLMTSCGSLLLATITTVCQHHEDSLTLKTRATGLLVQS